MTLTERSREAERRWVADASEVIDMIVFECALTAWRTRLYMGGAGRMHLADRKAFECALTARKTRPPEMRSHTVRVLALAVARTPPPGSSTYIWVGPDACTQ